MGYPKFSIEDSNDEQFYFNLHAVNKEIILTSEMYTTKQNCKNSIDSVVVNAPKDQNYDKLISEKNMYYFNLKAGNGEIIGTSEMYTTSSARDNGIEAVQRDAPKAEIENNTK